MILRIDPWAPEYDAALQLVADETTPDTAEAVDPSVETATWQAIVPAPRPRPPLALVDGVRRVELRVLAGENEPPRYGLFGSLAVGAVRLGARAEIGEVQVERALVLGGGEKPDRVTLRGGGAALAFGGHAVPDATPEAPLSGLQSLMRQAEADLAMRLAADGVVLVDGPLTYLQPSAHRIVGYVKRLRRAYLPPTHAPLLGTLAVGARTPLFLIHDRAGRFDRYSWYVRLASPGRLVHPLASVVRLEISAAVGLAVARDVGDLAAQHLPDLASTTDRDPRAPQNLVPVGALEQRLRHHLGDALWIRRSLMQHLAESAA